jgi:hypothetical protein
MSIGLVSDAASGAKKFYYELNDYDQSQVDKWLEENVIAHFTKPKGFVGNTADLKSKLEPWLREFGQVEMWSDCLSYDWVLFNHIWGHAFSLPKFIYYIPMDISTMLTLKGVDPDINREKFAKHTGDTHKHNALHDALMIKKCYERLEKMK